MASTKSKRSSKKERSGSIKFERTSSKQSISQTSDGLEELLHLSPEANSIIDLEKELMKRRDKLIWSLKDPQLYKEFVRFMSHSKSAHFIFVMNLFFLVFLFPSIIKFNYGKEENIKLWCMGEFILEVIMIVSGWLLYGCMCEKSIFRSGANWILQVSEMKSLEQLSNLLQAIYYLSTVSMRALDLIQRTVAGQCATDDILPSFSCNITANTGSFPLESFTLLVVIPILFICVARESRIGLNFVAWCITTAPIYYSCVVLKSSRSSVILFYYLVSGLLIILDSYKQCLLFYLLSRQLKKMIESNQRLALQNKATEMRHLIANVAHDLKTVSDLLLFYLFFSSSTSYLFPFFFLSFAYSLYPRL